MALIPSSFLNLKLFYQSWMHFVLVAIIKESASPSFNTSNSFLLSDQERKHLSSAKCRYFTLFNFKCHIAKRGKKTGLWAAASAMQKLPMPNALGSYEIAYQFITHTLFTTVSLRRRVIFWRLVPFVLAGSTPHCRRKPEPHGTYAPLIHILIFVPFYWIASGRERGRRNCALACEGGGGWHTFPRVSGGFKLY